MNKEIRLNSNDKLVVEVTEVRRLVFLQRKYDGKWSTICLSATEALELATALTKAAKETI